MSASVRIFIFCLVPIFLAGAGCTHTGTASRADLHSTKSTNVIPPLTDEQIEQRASTLAHFAAGVSLELNDKSTEALEEYYKAATDDPGNEQLVLELARRFLREKQNERAIQLLKKSASQPEATGAVQAWLGVAYIQTGQTNLAIEANRLAIKKTPSNLMPYQNLAQIYFETHNTNDAVKVIEQAAGEPSAPAEFYLGLCESYMRFARDQILPDKAARERILGLLDRTAKSKIENPILTQRLADLYFLFGEPGKAEPFYAEVLKEFPEAPGVRERLANIYFRNNQKEKAAEMLEGLRRANPTDPSTYYLLGSLAFEGKDVQKATDYFETAMKLNPDFEPIYYDLAGLKISAKKPAEALAVLDKARSKFKLNFTLEFYTGIAKGMLEKFPEALSSLTSAELLAKTTEPDRLNHLFYYQLGSTYERSGNLPDAEKAFKKCLEISPTDADAMNYMGYMWAERGVHLDEARALIERAVKIEPENAAFLDSLGWVLFKLNKPTEALDYIEKAIAKTEKADATLYDHLGDIEAELKHWEKAREAWNKSLEAEPSEKIKKKLEGLGAGASTSK